MKYKVTHITDIEREGGFIVNSTINESIIVDGYDLRTTIDALLTTHPGSEVDVSYQPEEDESDN
jgi:hypothetical protein